LVVVVPEIGGPFGQRLDPSEMTGRSQSGTRAKAASLLNLDGWRLHREWAVASRGNRGAPKTLEETAV